MKRTATISIQFDHVDCAIEFTELLHVSLDCFHCQRRMRTVIFQGAIAPYCTPTKHKFDGRLLSSQFNTDSAVYTIEYNYIPFTDAKYPDEQRYASYEKGSPSWARIHFIVQCPQCGRRENLSTQSNLVRPRNRVCRCGHQLFIDNTPPQMTY